jgi:hypothetical protein
MAGRGAAPERFIRRISEAALLEATLQELAEAGVAFAAHGSAGAVGEECHVAVLGVQIDALQAVQVDDVRAVHTQEASGVERIGETREGLRLSVLLPLGLEQDVIVLRLGEVELLDRDDANVRAVPHDNAGAEKGSIVVRREDRHDGEG